MFLKQLECLLNQISDVGVVLLSIVDAVPNVHYRGDDYS